MNRAERVVESMIVEPLEWVREQGIVLQSARGPVPNLAEYVAAEPIRGSCLGTRVRPRNLRGTQPRSQLDRRDRNAAGQRKDHAHPTPPMASSRSCREPLSQGTLGCRRRGAHCLGRPPNHRDPLSRMGPCPRNHRREATHCRRRARTTASLPPLIREPGQACDGAALVGVIAHRCWDQIIGDLRASAGDAHQSDSSEIERSECRPCSSRARATSGPRS